MVRVRSQYGDVQYPGCINGAQMPTVTPWPGLGEAHGLVLDRRRSRAAPGQTGQ